LTDKTNDFWPCFGGAFLCPKKKVKKKIKKKVAKQKNGLSLWSQKAQDDQHYLTF